MLCLPAFAPEDKFLSDQVVHITLCWLGLFRKKKKKSETNFILILLLVIAEGAQTKSKYRSPRFKKLGNF